MSQTNITQNEDEQHKEWQKLEASLEKDLEHLNESNIDDIFYKITNHTNIVWSQDLLIKYIICYKSQFGLSSNIICALVKRLSFFIPDFTNKLTKQIIFTFADSFQNDRLVETLELLSLIGDLFNYNVIAELVLLQVLQILSKGNDQKDDILSIRGIIKLMTVCGKTLQQTNKKVHDGVFGKLTTTKIKDDKATEAWKQLFELKDSEYENIPTVLIPKYRDYATTPEPVMFILAKELKEPDNQLEEFHFTSDINDIIKQWNKLKDLIANHPIVKENENGSKVIEEDEVAAPPQQEISQLTTEPVKDMTNTADIEFKKEIYLILKSSLSGDEAAHKILRRRTPDELKFNIVDIVIKSSIQEATYSKFYGIIAERLLNSHRAWKPAFNKVFKENYEQLDTFEPAQLRIVGKFWGHLFATDYIGFELFEIVKINAEESTAPSRIFIKFIFQELVADLSIDELKDRLNEDYIQPYIKGMFPSEDMEHIRYSINYFTAIGLGVLTDKMRERLTELEEETGEEEEEEEEEEEDVKEKNDKISLSRGPFRYNDRRRNDRPQFEHRSRQRSPTPPGEKRGEHRDRSISPPRNRYRNDLPQRYKDNITQRYRDNIPQRYRDNLSQRYRDGPPQRYRNEQYSNNYRHMPPQSRYNSSSQNSNFNLNSTPPPKKSRYNN